MTAGSEMQRRWHSAAAVTPEIPQLKPAGRLDPAAIVSAVEAITVNPKEAKAPWPQN
jgi:hypothetical protein